MVAVIDLGLKTNIVRALHRRGARVRVLPHTATLAQVLAPDVMGVVISPGPGRSGWLEGPVALAQAIIADGRPLLGICLGHQIVARAAGARTQRLRFGHHGANHPVRDEVTRRVTVTAQNHEVEVVGDSLPESSGFFVSQRNLNDGSVEGLRHHALPIETVQYHPEGSPGPLDAAEVFDRFLGHVRARSARTSRSERTRPRLHPHHRLGAGHHRPGGGVRLRRHAGLPSAAGGGRAHHPAQLQPGHHHDRPWCRRRRLPRAADGRLGRAHHRTGAARRHPGQPGRPDGSESGHGGRPGGVLERSGTRLLGTPIEAIEMAEDRERFRDLLDSIGQPYAPSAIVEGADELERAAATDRAFEAIGLPAIVRPAFTLGGTGGGIVDTREAFDERVRAGLRLSPIGQVMVERYLTGWQEIEYEVMRDAADTCIAVCSMENVDPLGVHTGDSIVVAPVQTLPDPVHQRLRTAALDIIRALGVEGGCNVQFALSPDSSDYAVIEVNPRVSRSSALASKATGYPIARVAAQIAIGRRLDEIPNAITGSTVAAFEPALDYVVVKLPRFPFDKFPGAERSLGSQMKATGEVMAIDRTFGAALNKALRGLEQAGAGFLAEDPAWRRTLEVLAGWAAGGRSGEHAAYPGVGGVPRTRLRGGAGGRRRPDQ